MEKYNPPVTISEEILDLTAKICEIVGEINFSQMGKINPHLRRENRIRTIHSSLAIEQNTLSLGQVTAIVGGKRVLGLEREIKEVKNAFEVYELIQTFDPYEIKDLLLAHSVMMNELVSENGRFRSGGVGVFKGERLLHIAPPPQFVYGQMENLLGWVKNSKLHPLVKSCIFHYEFEYIHPFADGNGRMGRMWQTLILSQYQELFFYLPIESIIKDRQEEYYKTLSLSDWTGDCVYFVEFMLGAILQSLKSLQREITHENIKYNHQNIEKLLGVLGDETLSAKEIMTRLKLSHMPTFRKNYLTPALSEKAISMTHPESARHRNQKYFRE